jgi:hypothetical protein
MIPSPVLRRAHVRLNLGRCAVVPGTQEKFPLLTDF